MEYHSPEEILDSLEGTPSCGLYYIRAKSDSAISGISADLYEDFKRHDRLSAEELSPDRLVIYTGQAKNLGGLRQRLLQELHQQGGPGTFFRSLGAVMGKNPMCAATEAGRRNYRFAQQEKQEIISFINANLEVAIVEHAAVGLNDTEEREIEKYKPLFNTLYNPLPSPVIARERERCRRYAARNI
jgi:hypothetical protein